MKIFLTGSTGFIGSYFLRESLLAGHDVIALRSRISSTPIISLPREPQWITKDLCALAPGDLQDCEVVVHAASAGVPPKKISWNEMVRVNVVGASSIIDTANKAQISRVVVTGTYQEYGHSFYPFKHSLDIAPLDPYSLYGASKASSFYLLSGYASLNNMELYYPRITHVYGIGAPEDSFWCALRSAASQGADFKMSTGDQMVDYIPVEKVAAVLLHGCTREMTKGEPLVELVGSGQVQTLLAFAKQEWKRLGAVGKLLPGEF